MDSGTPAPMPRAERGRRGGRKRWDRDAVARGLPPGPRNVRLADLDPVTREIVLAILAARGQLPGAGQE